VDRKLIATIGFVALLITATLLVILIGWPAPGTPAVQPRVEESVDQATIVEINRVTVVDEATGLPTRLGDEVTIEGIATVGAGVIHPHHTVMFLQDHTGGIGLFSHGRHITVARGDEVRVTGVVEHFNGLIQLNVVTYKVLSHNNPLPEPQEILVSDLTSFARAEPLEGELVRVKTKIVTIPASSIGGAYNITITDVTAEHTATLRVGVGTGIDLRDLTVSGIYFITGIVGQFDRSEPHHDEYRIFPRSTADLVFRHIAGKPELKSNLILLLTSDLHGYMEAHGTLGEIGGLSRIATLVREIKADHPGVLLLDGGDTIHGTPLAGLTEGEVVIAVMNAVGYHAMVVGNHDFNFGQDILAKRAKEAKFPFLGANVRHADGAAVQFLPPYAIFTVGKLKVGVIGLTCVRTPEKTHPSDIAGLQFLDPAAVAIEYARKLYQRVDAIILLLHMSWTDKRVVVAAVERKVPGILLAAVSADSHRQHYEVRRGIPMISAGEYGKALARLDILVEAGEVSERKGAFIPVTSEIEKCGEIEEMLAPYIAYVEEILARVVGIAAVALSAEYVRQQETKIGNLITDAIRQYLRAEIAIQNGGGIRACIDAGPITLGELYLTFPFDNYIVTLELTGEQLLAALENGVSRYPAGRFPHVSGMSFTFDPTREPGNRILEVKVHGLPLDLTTIYRVAVNCFMAGGGDGYVILRDVKRVVSERLLRDAVAKYIQAAHARGEKIEPQVEGRIRAVRR
jgi:2',3'-cyclic-nucleotide 2'-phosphodiesterase (5'-nucleotidase family)/DNA/RNA endonuclease YhcR with UshA esterase domain